jgi:hypothetical protein
MRAMTVRQPWAWAIIHGQKDVENRTRNIAGSYRGPVAITSSKQPLRGDDPGRSLIADLTGRYPLLEMPSSLGAILGLVDIVDVHTPDSCTRGWSAGKWPDMGWCSGWAIENQHHLVLANPRPLSTPIPVRGRLGLWTLPDDVAAQVEEALS